MSNFTSETKKQKKEGVIGSPAVSSPQLKLDISSSCNTNRSGNNQGEGIPRDLTLSRGNSNLQSPGMDNPRSAEKQQGGENKSSINGKGGLLDSSFQSQNNNSHVIHASHNNIHSMSGSYSNADSFNGYISRILPNKAQRVVDNIKNRYEKIKGIIEKQIKPNRFQLSDEEVSKITVSLEEFDEYRKKIDLEFHQYQNQKLRNGTFEDNLHDMHLNKNLQSCYQRVPSKYFLERSTEVQLKGQNTHLEEGAVEAAVTESNESAVATAAAVTELDPNDDFGIIFELSRSMKGLREFQEKLVEYLDDVELNLFYQVYFRFNQILEMILAFNKMGKECEDNLMNIRKLREFNRKIKSDLSSRGIQIVRQKKTIDRMEKTCRILEKLSLYKKNKENRIEQDPELATLFQVSTASTASAQGEGSVEEQVLKNLKRIDGYNIMERRYMQVTQLKEQDVYALFLEESSTYLRESLNFKEQIRRAAAVEQSIDVSSIHSYNQNLQNDSSLHFDAEEEEIDESLQQFDWVHSDAPIVVSTERKLVELYLKASHNFDMMRFEVFKNTLVKDIQKFLRLLLQGFQEYCINLYRQNSPHSVPSSGTSDNGFGFLNEINDILLMKFAQFLSNLARVFVNRALSLLHAMKNGAIQFALTEAFSESDWLLKVVPIVVAISKLQIDLLELFAQELLAYLHYTNTDTDANLAFKITTSNDLFAFWIDSFPAIYVATTALKLEEIEGFSGIPEKAVELLEKTNKEVVKSFDILFFAEQKSHLQIELFNTFDQKQQKLLEASLVRDTWTPANISYKLYQTLDYFFIQEKNQKETKEQDEEEDMEMENFNKLKNRMIVADSDEEEEEEEEDLQDMNEYYAKKPEREYKILLNKLIFEGENRRFMMTQGFLVFIRQIQRYIGLMWESQTSRSSLQMEKLIALIRFYNSTSRELIVKGKASRFAQMSNRITVKNLATSSLNLAFLKKILEKIVAKVPESLLDLMPGVVEEFEHLTIEVENHVSEIFSTITNILSEMISKSASAVNVLGWHKTTEKINVPLPQTAKIIDSIRTMFNVLEEILNASELKQVFEIIMTNITNVYLKTFENLLSSPDGNRLSVQRQKDEVVYLANEIFEISIMSNLPSTLPFITGLEGIVPLDSLPKLKKLKHRIVFGEDANNSRMLENEFAEQDSFDGTGSDDAEQAREDDHDGSEKKKKNKQLAKSPVDRELERIQKKFSSNSTIAEDIKSPNPCNSTHDTTFSSRDQPENE